MRTYNKGKRNGRFRHGHRLNGKRTKTYNSWRAMMQRCYNPNHWMYERYKYLGVTVCERWHKFANFLEDMGERPEGTTLDRIENWKGYEPGNCRWADSHTQRVNQGTVPEEEPAF
jgi:hypothetical protein